MLEKRNVWSPNVWKPVKQDFVAFLFSSQCLGWNLDCFENVGSSDRVFQCSQDYIGFLHFGMWQDTEQYKKYLRILPVLPLTKRLPFWIWNARRQESFLAGQSLLLPQHKKFRYILFFPQELLKLKTMDHRTSAAQSGSTVLFSIMLLLISISTLFFSSLPYHYKTNI